MRKPRAKLVGGDKTALVSTSDLPLEVSILAAAREFSVARTLKRIRDLVGLHDDPDAGTLNAVGRLLQLLATRTDLFPDAHFPVPAPDQVEALYLLSEDVDQRFALYLYRPNPGFSTPPHNHSTWAVIAGIEGEEPNTLWERTDLAASPENPHCELRPLRRFSIKAGQYAALRRDDIHSIQIGGRRPIKHLHLYGRSLMDLPQRMDFDPMASRWHYQTEKPLVLKPVLEAAY